jgi:hypothetical protein
LAGQHLFEMRHDAGGDHAARKTDEQPREPAPQPAPGRRLSGDARMIDVMHDAGQAADVFRMLVAADIDERRRRTQPIRWPALS